MNYLCSTTLALALCLLSIPAQAVDAFDSLRNRWALRLVGPASLPVDMPQVAAQVRAQSLTVQAYLGRMRTAPGAPLWDDIADFNNPTPVLASAAITSNARRLAQMAQAYAAPGTASYHDATLARAIVGGLERLLSEHYVTDRNANGNWWDWQIGTPQALLNTLTLAYDIVPADMRKRALATIQFHVPDPGRRTNRDGTLKAEAETGANLLDKALVTILSGVLARDSDRIELGRAAIGASLELVKRGDGFYSDGSFIQHTYIPYTGSYGVVLLADYARVLYLLDGSAWPISDPRASLIIKWARDSFAPLIIDGAMPDALRGRKIAWLENDDHWAGAAVIAILAELATMAPADDAAYLRSAVKGWMARDRSFGPDYLSPVAAFSQPYYSLHELSVLRAIRADSAIAPAAEAPGARIFASMDRVIFRGAGFGAVLALTSPRTSAFEAGNGENLQAWWTGMGMLSIYNADQSQFGPHYWATVDTRRLPGTTTDGSGSGSPRQWTQFPNPQAWVGGAELDGVAAVGMEFSMSLVTGSSLQGRKAWFMLGNQILALGSGIEGGSAPVETVVENRRLNSGGPARLLVDGRPLENGSSNHARWAHLQNKNSASGIGYVFPTASELRTERSKRSGSWLAVNSHASSPNRYEETYQILSIPQKQSRYAYLLLPNASVAETRAAASNPGMHIEANDAQSAAVSFPGAGVYAANLWRAGSAPLAGKAYVTSSSAAAVIIKRDAGRIRIAVSDPTQLAPTVDIELALACGPMVSASAGVTVLQTYPTVRLRVATEGAAGRSFHVELASRPH